MLLWETAILAAFRQIGRVQYERDFGGGTKPDLYFQMGASGTFELVADITTVSDVNYHNTNAREEFFEAIWRFLNKIGHTGAGIYIDVAHQQTGKYGDSKIKLLLPPKGQIIHCAVAADVSRLKLFPRRNNERTDVRCYQWIGHRLGWRGYW